MWQSIDSAPQDGSTITARDPMNSEAVQCHWSHIPGHPEGGAWITHGRGLLRPFRPTEWLQPSVVVVLLSPSALGLPAIPDQTPVVLLQDGYVPVERTAMVQAVLGVST